ncbi:MAG: polyphosphate kinase 2 family protein [Cyclobacteriaceae bacterium]|nr:polyphosphate kinase 2 family protein [Cyclobacteriaceae bacterium]
MINDAKFIAAPGSTISLSNFSTDEVGEFKSKKDAKEKLREDTLKLQDLQHKLYAHNQYAMLLIFQAMDAAGKDGTIKHVMSGVNPQGCQVFSFKQPSQEELDHDYFWRVYRRLPERGRIGIFNRSYYEEVLIVRVHPEFLLKQQLPGINSLKDVNQDFWQCRYRQIREIERVWADNGIVILKFFLHVSHEEQKKRFLKRIENPEKNWKFSFQDIKERDFWEDYQQAYEQAISATSNDYAPWYIIPADHKWYMRTVVGDIIVRKMASLPLKYPTMSGPERGKIMDAKKILEGK